MNARSRLVKRCKQHGLSVYDTGSRLVVALAEERRSEALQNLSIFIDYRSASEVNTEPNDLDVYNRQTAIAELAENLVTYGPYVRPGGRPAGLRKIHVLGSEYRLKTNNAKDE
jgi:hypothetical protein